ncbi:MAG: winged helix-turn-helix domain-containing protein [Chloroflexi bacterium]|nr:winged helix-turn-helix domain-containing protein [Chloroflexota bacterium]MBT4073605.1 winged helix-turn-helix domain-containing protein [Chloroflexota bacterium]MBT4515695.1 winged helix-turn-helix domain-containing protein [Chloroflexota bacterium]MBT5318773.1 winged helix-turn-helix domain-containing protein [Chloroflexota bacterium]MBT6680793.1 winged helix-turn-helix domain-containing protein [Chloroflexota bacterium]
MYVGYLRGKVEREPRKPSMIRTVREFGYSYRPPQVE